MKSRISEGRGEFSLLLPSMQTNRCCYIVFSPRGKKESNPVEHIIAVGTILDPRIAKGLSNRGKNFLAVDGGLTQPY